MIAKLLWHLKILDVTGLNPALHENVFWTDFAKISHSEGDGKGWEEIVRDRKGRQRESQGK